MIERLAKGRIVILLLAAYLIVTFFWLRLGPAAILTQTGVPLLDTTFGYTPAEAYERLSTYGDLGRRSYASFLVGDFLIGPLYALAIFALLALALTRSGRARSGWRWVAGVPVSVALFDWVENGSLLALTSSYPDASPALAGIASGATFIKLLLGALSLLLALLAVLSLLMRRRAAR